MSQARQDVEEHPKAAASLNRSNHFRTPFQLLQRSQCDEACLLKRPIVTAPDPALRQRRVTPPANQKLHCGDRPELVERPIFGRLVDPPLDVVLIFRDCPSTSALLA